MCITVLYINKIQCIMQYQGPKYAKFLLIILFYIILFLKCPTFIVIIWRTNIFKPFIIYKKQLCIMFEKVSNATF